MIPATIQISEKFKKIDTKDLDERSRLHLGKIKGEYLRYSIFKSDNGDILLRPLVEVPACEAWFFKNKKAVNFAEKSLKDAAEGRVKELDTNSL
ncbi:MAG: hypothetical protein IH840_17965 [Candidatus Heimdallarchaeota archaeon]|nr:hypothetical protein [Candidatus Heimdallarchaeota archaeon]